MTVRSNWISLLFAIDVQKVGYEEKSIWQAVGNGIIPAINDKIGSADVFRELPDAVWRGNILGILRTGSSSGFAGLARCSGTTGIGNIGKLRYYPAKNT